ncbi:MAG: hypothetical protein LBT25_05740 [Candidatus Symbiothrix sp.]|nr:hypothetical protein [Candidatus Symbiothrix sp.]
MLSLTAQTNNWQVITDITGVSFSLPQNMIMRDTLSVRMYAATWTGVQSQLTTLSLGSSGSVKDQLFQSIHLQ